MKTKREGTQKLIHKMNDALKEIEGKKKIKSKIFKNQKEMKKRIFKKVLIKRQVLKIEKRKSNQWRIEVSIWKRKLWQGNRKIWLKTVFLKFF